MNFASKSSVMNHFLKVVLFLCCLQFSDVIDARPISWPGGSTIMYKSNFMMTSYYYHYSPTYKYSMGLEYIDDKHFNEKYLNFRTTYLIKRKNTQDSQGNLYITGSLSSKSSSHYNYGIHGIGRLGGYSLLSPLSIRTQTLETIWRANFRLVLPHTRENIMIYTPGLC